MKTRKRRFGVAAAAVIALAVAFTIPGTSTAWSVEQTIAAMKKIETLHITGTNLCHQQPTPFDCWVRRLSGADANSFRMRYQCRCERKTTLVAQGNTVYLYSPTENAVRILDGAQVEELQYWYEAAKISPWLTGKLLETLRLIGHKWEQTVETDPNTGKEQIVVTFSHPASNISALLIVDSESKLVRRAKLWHSLQREGEPMFDARVFTYNPEVPEEFFAFKIPPGATVISKQGEQEAKTRFDRAEQLFHQDKKYAEALEVYQQVYDGYPYVGWGSTSLMMIGLCHRRLGDDAQAIESYQKALREFPTGWEGVVQFYLGVAYLHRGQTQEALQALEACLADAEGKRGPDQFPVKDAREHLAKIKGQ